LGERTGGNPDTLGTARTGGSRPTAAEPITGDSQLKTTEPTTGNSQLKAAEPTTGDSQFKTTEPTTGDSQFKAAEPTTGDSQFKAAEPATGDSRPQAAEPTTGDSQRTTTELSIAPADDPPTKSEDDTDESLCVIKVVDSNGGLHAVPIPSCDQLHASQFHAIDEPELNGKAPQAMLYQAMFGGKVEQHGQGVCDRQF
jgi:hypothetical protein